MIRNIQLVRAWGACLVVLHHLKPHYEAIAGRDAPLAAFMAWSFAGVDLFFVVSGFIMMQVIDGRPATRRRTGCCASIPGTGPVCCWPCS